MTHRLGRFHDGDCLYGGAIAEPGTLTIDDTRDVDVRAHAMFLSNFDHLVIRTDSLSDVSSGTMWYSLSKFTVSIGGNGDFAPFCIS